MNSLTPKQEKFIEVYSETGNASEAYRVAYPVSLKWNEESVHQAASRLLKNIKVLSRVQQIKAQNREISEIKRKDILELLARVLRGDQIPDYSETAGEITRIRTLSKSWAIERACRMLGYEAAQKSEVSGQLNFGQLLMETGVITDNEGNQS